MVHRLTAFTIQNEAELRSLLGEPTELVREKIVDRLNAKTRRFVEKSPMCCLATSDAAGYCDVSPRGDPAGFVQILDDRTLLVPERPGNKLADALRNIISNPRIALLFLLPGLGETFRINGRATITTDTALLASSAVEGKAPKLGILVDIEAAYAHCPKAMLRAHLWDPTAFLSPDELPTSGEILREIRGEGFDGEAYDRERAERYRRREGFY
jgi:PPOX class probable FMN-dependent enzyme